MIRKSQVYYMINDVNVDGRVSNDIKYTATKNGLPVARFNFANSYINKKKEQKTQFLMVTAYSKTADYCHKFLKKGQRAFINGRIDKKTTKDKDGQYHDFSSIIAQMVDPINHKSQTKSTRDIYAKMDKLNNKLNKISKNKRHKKDA